ncbi:hypothetical protein PGH47_18305 [Streptomyces sp. HUAS 31]|uniref:hypothetical protein n=1 Tax=Streptomyces sp. HUAS 31 TaxID=3020055 RepID=UPI0023057004|nr:hypothetical protein [Streptomyces sp. HUAS 31]WCD97518.1 hypothetical protein PGH47_18305 [Streptomyces sp. HUAS 31]
MSFEIRIICDPADRLHVVAALDDAFNAGTVTVYPTQDGEKNRLYVRADHKHTPERDVTQWPNAIQAYTNAPEAATELEWLLTNEDQGREWWLRRAALTDRMAHGLTPGHTASTSNALDLASRLIYLDDAFVACNPRAYVRQQYALWAKNR